MTAVPATVPDISPDFVAGLAERAQEAEGLRRLPGATVDDFVASSRELAGALTLGMAVARTAMV
jgi:hypothetical protein